MEKRNGTILIIAESREITAPLTRLLTDRFDLITAGSGEAGLRRFSQVKEIDLVFLELELSDLDGLTVLCFIRRINQVTPVVVITGPSSTLSASAVAPYGITAYLTKPLDGVKIERVMHRMCAAPSLRRSDIECMRDFIEEHFTEKITVKDIAAASSLSYRQVARKFKKRYGCTITEYVRRRRVEKAKKLLCAQCLWIYDVALLVGFSNSKTFCAAFKSLTDETPHQYQERMARAHASKPSSQIPLPFQT